MMSVASTIIDYSQTAWVIIPILIICSRYSIFDYSQLTVQVIPILIICRIYSNIDYLQNLFQY